MTENKSLATLETDEGVYTLRKAQAFIDSGLLPRAITKPNQALVIMLKGRELGMQPMQSFAHLNVIEGKPVLDSQGMLSQVLKNCKGAQFNYLEMTNEVCTLEAVRPGSRPAKLSFTFEDAQRAGLTHKDNWKKYPRAMLRNRAVAEMCRALFADCIDNALLPDEAEEIKEATRRPEASQDKDKAKDLTQLLKSKAETIDMAPSSMEIEPEVKEPLPF
jgi:hypothetical protein